VDYNVPGAFNGRRMQEQLFERLWEDTTLRIRNAGVSGVAAVAAAETGSGKGDAGAPCTRSDGTHPQLSSVRARARLAVRMPAPNSLPSTAPTSTTAHPAQIAEISVNKQLENVQKLTFDDMFGYDAAIRVLDDDNMELAAALWKCVSGEGGGAGVARAAVGRRYGGGGGGRAALFTYRRACAAAPIPTHSLARAPSRPCAGACSARARALTRRRCCGWRTTCAGRRSRC
jgi:hypothetical protein